MTTDEHTTDCRSHETYANGCEPEACDCSGATDTSSMRIWELRAAHAALENELAAVRATAARSERELQALRTAALAVCDAWTIAGPSPAYHSRQTAALWANWPMLANAVQALTAVGSPMRRGVLGEWPEVKTMSPPIPISAEGFEPVRRPGPRHAKPMQPPQIVLGHVWRRS